MDPLTDSSAQLTEHWLTAHTSQGGSSRQMRQLSFNSQGCQHGEISRNVNLAHTREYVFGNVCQHAAQMASRVSLAPHYFRERTFNMGSLCVTQSEWQTEADMLLSKGGTKEEESFGKEGRREERKDDCWMVHNRRRDQRRNEWSFLL